MKRILGTWIQLAFTIASLCAISGCYSMDAQGRKIGVHDPLPRDAPKGYAEFHIVLPPGVSTHLGAIYVCWNGENTAWTGKDVECRKKLSSLHSVDMDHYMRFAVPPGQQGFFVGSHFVLVPITENMITPVDLVVQGESAFAPAPGAEFVVDVRAVIRDAVAVTPLR